VTAKPGPILVIAGAGSGKTRTLTYRVAYLIENGVEPENILLLTFTNKASREMLDRVGNLLPHDISRIWGGTFHSVANRLLRRHANELGFSSDFTILDRDDAADLAVAALKATGLDPKDKTLPKGAVLLDIFGLAASTEKSIASVVVRNYPYFTRSSTSSNRSTAFSATARRPTT
jgi:DNA helicase-2/ATP-dependent DNA helicase PcrA